jgi:hypothetical protein
MQGPEIRTLKYGMQACAEELQGHNYCSSVLVVTSTRLSARARAETPAWLGTMTGQVSFITRSQLDTIRAKVRTLVQGVSVHCYIPHVLPFYACMLLLHR